jgi:hypothetical protein
LFFSFLFFFAELQSSKRHAVFEEIVTSERKYVSYLRTLVEIWMKPLKEDPNVNHLMPEELYKKLFFQLDVRKMKCVERQKKGKKDRELVHLILFLDYFGR